MASLTVLDTCFLIALQQEARRAVEGPATLYLRQHGDDVFGLAMVSLTQFLEGFAHAPEGEILLRPFQWLEFTPDVARAAATLRRHLRKQGQLLGDFDILIAATALHHEAPLVTENVEHFRRVPGLQVISWRN